MGRKLQCFYEKSGKTAVSERKAAKSVTFKLLNTRITQVSLLTEAPFLVFAGGRKAGDLWVENDYIENAWA